MGRGTGERNGPWPTEEQRAHRWSENGRVKADEDLDPVNKMDQ